MPEAPHTNREVMGKVLHAVEDVEASRAGFVELEGGVGPEHQAHAVGGRGRHWTLMAAGAVTTVCASRLDRDEQGVTFTASVSCDPERVSLPITVMEIDEDLRGFPCRVVRRTIAPGLDE